MAFCGFWRASLHCDVGTSLRLSHLRTNYHRLSRGSLGGKEAGMRSPFRRGWWLRQQLVLPAGAAEAMFLEEAWGSGSLRDVNWGCPSGPKHPAVAPWTDQLHTEVSECPCGEGFVPGAQALSILQVSILPCINVICFNQTDFCCLQPAALTGAIFMSLYSKISRII